MASKAAHKRLTKEYMTMQRDPPPFVWAVPEEKNILTLAISLGVQRGPPDSPFAGGEYHGYPFKPPGIKMLTPSGRFQPDRKICFSMSDFHPGTWNPAWSVSTILTGLLSFMLSDEMTTGSVTSTDPDKRIYAVRSHAWNLTQKRFKEALVSPQTSATTVTQPALPTSSTTTDPNALSRPSRPGANGEAAANAGGWADAWRQVFWEKWRWGVILALALVVSRMSSR
ncbi:UBC-like protein [Fomitopsis serialis]|uniref:UBC-like protein n=1 Tax=Fomitopsis serialis TaxID=139415 RepID=UPI002008DBF3|nr:UBC-like protein [Neoantrodia serialis]KAH9933434.1 UBC-like protein [Neoantrodia serialis]